MKGNDCDRLKFQVCLYNKGCTRAAKKDDESPVNCMVLKDGDASVKSAQAAGMQWVREDWI